MDEPRDAVQAASHPDPYPWYAQLPPIAFDPGLRLWVVARAALVREALLHPALQVRPPAEPVPAALQGRPTGEVFARLVRMNDGAFHARHRPAVAAAAQRWQDAEVAAAAHAAAADLVGRLAGDALLTAVPVQATARLLGVPLPALDATVARVHAFAGGIVAGASAAALDAADAAVVALVAQGEAQGLAAVAAANRIALMQQSLDATAGLIGTTVRLDPAAVSFEALQAFVAEVARWDAPVQNTRRFAAQPLLLGGQAIAAGDGLLLLLGAANRDLELNPQPDRFDAARPDRRSLTFGAGAHACPGERIAIVIATAALHPLRQQGPLSQSFGTACGWRPLPNARIPVFSIAQGAAAW
ncbi:MAG TPA: cytochrome P450 [Ramlibacter sp.]